MRVGGSPRLRGRPASVTPAHPLWRYLQASRASGSALARLQALNRGLVPLKPPLASSDLYEMSHRGTP